MTKQLSVFILIIACCFSANLLKAQQSNGELANQYFSTKEYDKAIIYFDKFYDQDPGAAYPNYLKCLLQIKEFDKAEKLIRKQQKKFPGDVSLKLDQANLFEIQELPDKAKKVYDDLIKNLAPDINQVSVIGNLFIQRQMPGYAVQTYLQGRKVMKNAYPFSFELAEAYSQDNKIPEMVNEYIEALGFNASYLGNVQTILQNKIGSDLTGTISELVRQNLLRRIQKMPDETIYAEFLYWLFLQEKDYESAYIQAKGLDKRLGESGDRIIALGRVCANNAEYATAIQCFQYVVDKGSSQPNYATARIELINAVNGKVTGTGNYTQTDLNNLERDYKATLTELGKTPLTAPLLRGYAHLQAFYLHKADSAIALLNEALELPNLQQQFRAECKLELADIYVFKGEVWDAALLYGQVDKDFKNDALGREAKYRNARLSYFIGEFDWAKDQLNVLKAATSQLISNDALALALLITDNTNMDTSTTALLMYSRADLLDFQNKDSMALITLDSILDAFPGHSLSDDIYYKKAMIYKKEGKFALEDSMLTMVVTKFGKDILADDALFQLGLLYQDQLNDKTKAQKYFEDLLTNYPGSLYTVDARKRFRSLRGDKIN